MQISIDSKYNVAYIRFKDADSTVNSLKISDDLVLDIAPDGTLYGIELLNAKDQLQDHLSIINSLTGKQETLKIAL